MMDKTVGIALSIACAVVATTLVAISFRTSDGPRIALLAVAVVLVAACTAMLAVAVKGTTK